MDTPAIRAYRQGDAQATADVFQAAIRITAARHYRPHQIDAWASGATDLVRWNQNRWGAWTVVAELGGRVVGFSDLTTSGELDMLFVHPVAGGRGIARLLVAAVLDEARQRNLPVVATHASRTARPVFGRLGFVVDAENQRNMVRGVVVPNFDMHIDL